MSYTKKLTKLALFCHSIAVSVSCMTASITTIQAQLDKANGALLKVLDGEVVEFGYGVEKTRVEMSNVQDLYKIINALERKLAAVQRSASGRYGMGIKVASFN